MNEVHFQTSTATQQATYAQRGLIFTRRFHHRGRLAL